MARWQFNKLVILAFVVLITKPCTSSLLPRPLIDSHKSHGEYKVANDLQGKHPNTNVKLNEKDVDKSFAFAAGIVERLKRLETSLGWSQVHVKLGTPAHDQLLNVQPELEALDEAKEALIAAKATAHLMAGFCYKHKLTTSSCAKHFTKLKTSPYHRNHICHNNKTRCAPEEERSSYRTIDGSCNDISNAQEGRSFTSYGRLLFPEYLDGVQEPKRSAVRKYKLPSPRTVSTSLAGREELEDEKRTLSVMQWGQFVGHDMFHTVVNRMVHTGATIQCCASNGFKLSPRYLHPFCAPIDISSNDKFYSKHGLQCMTYVRSATANRADCSLGPIEQLNQVTHFLDGSQIYGSTKKKAESLRRRNSGELRTSKVFGRELMPLVDDASKHCHAKDGVCFVAGDPRANFQPQLTAMHTIWMREHNRIARKLAELNPKWDDEKLYSEARKIVVAEIQHITYKDWLPKILGDRYFEEIEKPATYNKDVDPSVSNSFATAAFRFLKSLMAGTLSLYTEDRIVNSTIKLAENFNKPEILSQPGFLDALVRGLATQRSQKADFRYVEDVADLLYGNGKVGFDAVSLDIQRGRDHGLPGYTKYRTLFGLGPVKTFKNFEDLIPTKAVQTLSEVYKDPNDVDLLVGGMLERNTEDSLLGPTFSGLIADQFLRTRSGDRHFYTFQDVFSKKQLEEVKKSSLARVFCDNGDDIRRMQRDVFEITKETNYPEDCSRIPHVNLEMWKE